MARLAEQIMPAVSGAMSIAADVIGKVADFFSSLPEPVQEVITVIGMIIVILGALAPVILTVTAAVTALQIPLLPLIAIIAGVIAAITAVILIIKNWGAISEWLGGVVETVGNWLKETWELSLIHI